MKSVSQLSRRFRVVFDDDKTVPNAGLVIPLRLADRLGFRDAVNRRVRGRNQRRRPNSGDKALAIVAMLAAGGEFISDVDVLGAGSTLHRLGYRWFSQSRLGEWLRSLTDVDIDGFADAVTEITDTAWTAGLGPDLDAVSAAGPLIVDLDSTFTETHGTQKDGTTRRNYQGMHGYHPLLAVEASTGDVIAAMLREGNTATSGVGAFTADTLKRARRLAGDDTALLLRADSGFYLRELFDHCVAHDTRFSVAVRQYAPIRDLIDNIAYGQWKTVKNAGARHNGNRHIDIASVPFEIKGHNYPRTPIKCRLIVRRVTTPADADDPQLRLFDPVDHYAFVTDQDGEPETLWRRHNHRAVIETTIRDLKYGLGLNHYPSGSFTANAAWLHLNTLAHNLLHSTNQLITPTPMVAKTIRYRYLTIPGRITTGSRTTTLHLPTTWPRQHHITDALTTIRHLNAA
ncbi:MAG: IS1380 family transposase [Actinomycetia bacterium]|nr:IS1380 family transposase [Actinomycetes bacterium]